MLDINVYLVTPKISEINWSDFVLVHSWSGFCTCSNCCSWLLESLLPYVYKQLLLYSDFIVSSCYEKPVKTRVKYTQYTRIVQIHWQPFMQATWVWEVVGVEYSMWYSKTACILDKAVLRLALFSSQNVGRGWSFLWNAFLWRHDYVIKKPCPTPLMPNNPWLNISI